MTEVAEMPQVEESPETQCQALLAYLQSNPITAFEALVIFGIGRCAARIHQLRQQGHKIHTGMVRKKKANGKYATVAMYWLEA